MNPERKERIVDSMLDRALGPQPVEPRAGFEERLLANLASQPQRHPWWQWMWVPALAAATLLAVVIGMKVLHREPAVPQVVQKTVETPKQQKVAVAPPVAPAAAPSSPRRNGLARGNTAQTMVIARTTPLPKQDVFPSPVPLTEQERLLLALMRRTPNEAKLVAIEQQAERERIQKYFETGEPPAASPAPAQTMR